MIIEITGAGFSNKGAQLMLAAVCERLRQAFPGVTLAIPPEYASFTERRTYQLQYVLRRPSYCQAPWRFARELASNIKHFRLPPRFPKTRKLLYPVAETQFAKSLGLTTEEKADALIDISGYAFGDACPLDTTLRVAKKAARYKRRGRPALLLPQMLGPFNEEGHARAFSELAACVDLVYVRDRTSYAHAQLVMDRQKLKLAPDVTIPMLPTEAPRACHAYVCIVPNSNVLQRNLQDHHWRGRYISRLVKACSYVRSKGLEIKIVQHEYGRGDRHLVDLLEKRCDNCGVVRHPDPLALKRVLGNARLVIGSRFHSLVSALSMRVPSIALGWAHKYDALMDDFGMSTFMHQATDPENHLMELIDGVLQEHCRLVVMLARRRDNLAANVESMWQTVLCLLAKGCRSSSDSDSLSCATRDKKVPADELRVKSFQFTKCDEMHT